MIRGIYIIGLPGSHKYKIGEYLRGWLDWEVIDLQEEVEKSLHKTLLEIIDQKQLKSFENEQEKFILSHIKSGIVFISSDVVPKPEIISKLKENGIVPIYLNYSKETLEKEIQRNQELNTILKVHPFEEYQKEIEDISSLLINVPTEGFTDREVAVMIVRALKSEYDLIFSNNDKAYEGINAFNHINEILEYEGFSRAFFITYKKLFVINFKWVFDVIKNLDFEPIVFFLPEKEEIKELDWVKKIWFEILNLKIKKDTAIVGIGGGSSLDLVGFCASTFKRGFPFVSVPTTFISQIDASIGGRNAIHYLNHKNVLGTIYYPRFILIDPVFVLTSDKEKFLYSLSDAIRYGLLFDSEIIDYLEDEEVKIKKRYLPTIENFIRKCALIKLNVCHIDPYGWSQTRYFEFGNTIAYLIQEVLHLDYPKALTKSIYLILKFLKKNNILKEKTILKRIEKLFELYTLDYHLSEIDIEKLNKKCQFEEIEITGIETYKSPLMLKIKKEEIFKL